MKLKKLLMKMKMNEEKEISELELQRWIAKHPDFKEANLQEWVDSHGWNFNRTKEMVYRLAATHVVDCLKAPQDLATTGMMLGRKK